MPGQGEKSRGLGFSPAGSALLAEVLLPSFPPREEDRDPRSSLFPKRCLQEASLIPGAGPISVPGG